MRLVDGSEVGRDSRLSSVILSPPRRTKNLRVRQVAMRSILEIISFAQGGKKGAH